MKEKISRLFAKNIQNKKFKTSGYKKDATANWILQKSKLNCLKLNIDIPIDQIEKEITSIPDELFVDHRDESYEANRGWKSFVLYGKSYDATRESEFYNDDRSMIWTPEALKYCTQTVSYFQNFWPCKDFDRIRVMLLSPNGIINLHRDHSPPGSLAAVNIAITQPPGCEFYLDNYGVIPFEAGTAFMVNVSNYHTVINDSNENRYHIIVHQNNISNDLANLVKVSYNRLYAS
jgi:hypothetical protein